MAALMGSLEEEVEWPTRASDYEVQGLVGEGAFAKVYKARCPARGVDVAIKVIDLEKVTSSLEDIMNEVKAMKQTNHPNVLSCHSAFVADNTLWLVMPLMDKGSCLHIMRQLKKAGYGEGMRQEWCAAILKATVQGLKYLHEQGYIHRDIKAGNILMDSSGAIKIADFGVSGALVDAGVKRKSARTFVGTPCWMAPEVMEQVHGYDSKADIWSLGITALELGKGYAPYAKYTPMKVLLMTLQNDPPSLKDYDDEKEKRPSPGTEWARRNVGYKDLVKYCLVRKPSQRKSCKWLLDNARFLRNAQEPEVIMAEICKQLPGKITDLAKPLELGERLPGTMPLFAGVDGEGKEGSGAGASSSGSSSSEQDGAGQAGATAGAEAGGADAKAGAGGEGAAGAGGDGKKMATAADLRSHLSKIKRRAGATWVFNFDAEGKSVDAKAEAEKRASGAAIGGAAAGAGGGGAQDAGQKGQKDDLSTLGGFEDAFNKTTSMRESGMGRR